MPRERIGYVADFDSASAMLRALGRYLHGEGFPGLGSPLRHVAKPLAPLVNALPSRMREQVYTWSGWLEAVPPRKLDDVDEEAMARWVVDHYPRRRYPAVAIGSSSGALLHLCAALGIPWLPQTLLIPVRRSGGDPEDLTQEEAWGRQPGTRLLERTPSLQLHHMHDPVQDRLMVRRMAYFRVKRLRLGPAYERFLEEVLEPGGTLILSDCRLTWPGVEQGERHVFQIGALGGATKEEYLHGGPRVAESLARQGSPRRRWSVPAADGEWPEAEWGLAPALGEDVRRFADRRGYRVRHLRFEDPEHLSPLVADLYRWWYRRRRMPANRLLIESFIVMEPYWALRTGSVPFWMTFNTEVSADAVERYLDRVKPFDAIHLMLFSHGVDSIGVVPVDRWRAILARARRRGAFAGVQVDAYPRDFATFVRYHEAMRRDVPARYPMPGPLTLGQLDAFLAEAGGDYHVEWTEGDARTPASSA